MLGVAIQLRECLRKQQELQKWKNQRLEEKLLNATDLAHAEEQHAARQKEHERVLETRATEYARTRQQWKDGRDQDQMAHAHEVATLKKRNVSPFSRNHQLALFKGTLLT